MSNLGNFCLPTIAAASFVVLSSATDAAHSPQRVGIENQSATSETITVMTPANTASESIDQITVAREVIVSLIDHRDHLGYMLEHAAGHIDDDEMREITSEWLRLRETEDAALTRKVAALAILIGDDRIDSGLIATVFHCDVIQAMRAIDAWGAAHNG